MTDKFTDDDFKNCSPFETMVLMAMEGVCVAEVVNSLFHIISTTTAYTMVAFPDSADDFFSAVKDNCNILIESIPLCAEEMKASDD